MTTSDPEKPDLHIELIAATQEQQPILANLLELYIHDFTELLHLDLGEDGRFGYKNLSSYWQHPDHFPFLVRVNGKLAGLALVKGSGISDHESTWDMAEFFIVRGYRRCGIGTAAAREVWRRFPGRWQVRVLESNEPARRFWNRAILQFTAQPAQATSVKTGQQNWHVFSFKSEPD